MSQVLSSAELVKRVRGARTQIAFAELLGVAQSMISDWERGAVTPSPENWIKMAVLTNWPLNAYCYERMGLPQEAIRILSEALWKKERDVGARFVRELGLGPEPVTEPLGDEPVGGEPASLRGTSETVEEWCARNNVRPPGEPIARERKPPAPAKKAKRERRRKK